jgi:hypothetical protein
MLPVTNPAEITKTENALVATLRQPNNLDNTHPTTKKPKEAGATFPLVPWSS